MTDKTELESLKERADLMGIEYSRNIGVNTLRERVNGQLQGTPEKSSPKSYKNDSKERDRLIRQATKLKRVQITCTNPNKKDIKGEYFSFANAAVGTVTRFVPFDVVTHVEAAIISIIRERKFARVSMVKNREGIPHPQRKLVLEFGVSDFSDLNAKELKELSDDQTKRGAIDR